MTSASGARVWPWATLTFAIFTAGALMAVRRRTDVDVGWLLTLGEKMLDGHRPYIDVFEANPPMSILLYLPAVITGRGLGVTPDLMVVLLTLLAIGGSLWLSGRILAPWIEDRASLWRLAASAAFVLAVLPTGVSTQREHIAVIALLPFLATAIASGAGQRPAAILAALAGLGCGVAMAIKPHFALAAGGALLVQAWRQRSIRPLIALEVWTASMVVCLYVLVIVVFFPGFLGFLPVIRDVYLPVRQPLSALLTWPPVPAWLVMSALAVVVAWRRPGAGWPVASLLAASVGGFASYLIQGKGWPYHSYPMLALAALGLASAVCLGAPSEAPAQSWDARRTARVGLAAAGVALGLGALGLSMRWFTLKGDYHLLDRPVAAIAAHPRLLSITADIAVGEPLVRELQGRWVGGVCSQWISAGALTLERRGGVSANQRARLDALMDFDRRLLARDIAAGRPDVILIGANRDWLGWARRDPALAAELAAYRPLETVQGVAIWARRPAG